MAEKCPVMEGGIFIHSQYECNISWAHKVYYMLYLGKEIKFL